MTSGPALTCPSCTRRLRETDWIDERSCSCGFCRTYFDGLVFPAATRVRAAAKPQAVAVAEDSTCFFHGENQAEKVCDGCGRFLCSVCAVPMPGGLLCPSCIAAQKTKSPTIVPKRVLFDGLALSLVIGPVLLFPLWMLTVATAPIALFLVFYGWNKPTSLVHTRRRWRLILAGVLALAEIGLICFIGFTVFRHR